MAGRTAPDDDSDAPISSFQPPKSKGNIVGIIIASVLVLVIAITIIMILMFPSPSDRVFFQKSPELLKRMQVGIDVATILPSLPNGSGNAASDYKEAAALTKANKSRVEAGVRSIFKSGGAPQYDQLPEDAVNALKAVHAKVASGAQKKDMTYVFEMTDKELKLERTFEPAQDLVNTGELLLVLGMHYKDKKEYAQAEKVFLDIFTMGWHMFNEDTIVQIPDCGLSIMTMALNKDQLVSLVAVYNAMGNAEKAKKADDFGNAADSLKSNFIRKLDTLWKNPPPPGDVFAVIEDDQSRAWKTQGLLLLGIVKLASIERGDRKMAENLIEKYSASQDPYLAAAAQTAAKATPDSLMLLR